MKKKVLMIGPSTSGNGGIASVIKSYSENENISSFIDLISSYKDGNKTKKTLAFIEGYIRCFTSLLFNKNIEVVHIHSASRASFTRKRYFFKLSKMFNKKVIYHIHGAEFMKFYEESSEKVKIQISNLLSNSDKIIVLGEYWKRSIYEISQNSNIEVLYNPIKTEDYKISNLDNENILFMGRLERRKGIYDLLEVIPDVAKEFPNIKFNLCGDGEICKVKDIVKNKNIDCNVIIPGWIEKDDKLEFIKSSSVYVLPSYDEGLPVSILEAMSGGLPVISTKVGSISEQIENEYNGFLINAGDLVALKNMITKLLKDKILREEMGKRGRNKAEEHFDISKIEEQLLTIYKNI